MCPVTAANHSFFLTVSNSHKPPRPFKLIKEKCICYDSLYSPIFLCSTYFSFKIINSINLVLLVSHTKAFSSLVLILKRISNMNAPCFGCLSTCFTSYRDDVALVQVHSLVLLCFIKSSELKCYTSANQLHCAFSNARV